MIRSSILLDITLYVMVIVNGSWKSEGCMMVVDTGRYPSKIRFETGLTGM